MTVPSGVVSTAWSQVSGPGVAEVSLDASFQVLGHEADDDGSNDQDGSNDD